MHTDHDSSWDVIRARTQQIVLIQDTPGVGTGLAVGLDGWVLTNKHVAPGVGPYRVILGDGRNVHGVGVHQSARHDLAIVKVAETLPSAFDLDRDLAEDYIVGAEVFALGHPRGCRFSVSRGIISNPYREFEREYFVQTDVSINPGNSGGPLIDRAGRLVGVVAMMLTASQGIGFAVPGHTAADYVRHVRRLVRQGVVRIPEAILETVDARAPTPEQAVRGAIGALVEVGRLSIEDEKTDDGWFKLKHKNAEIEVRCAGASLRVHGRVIAVGPGELGNNAFLQRVLSLNGAQELGGAMLGLADGALVASVVRPTTGLSVTEAVWAIEAVRSAVVEWPEKLAGMLYTPAPQVPADPGYPLLQMPSAPWNPR